MNNVEQIWSIILIMMPCIVNIVTFGKKKNAVVEFVSTVLIDQALPVYVIMEVVFFLIFMTKINMY